MELWDEAKAGVDADTGLTPEAIFVREYVSTGDALLACNRAGLGSSQYPLSVMAERQLARPEIQVAIEAFRSTQGVATGDEPPSRELQVDKLEAIYRQALEDGSYSAAATAVKLQNELLGYADKTVNYNFNVTAQELPLHELRAMVAKKLSLSGPVIDAEYENIPGPEEG
jgi:hypothetical protein